MLLKMLDLTLLGLHSCLFCTVPLLLHRNNRVSTLAYTTHICVLLMWLLLYTAGAAADRHPLRDIFPEKQNSSNFLQRERPLPM